MLVEKFYRWLAFRGKKNVNEVTTIGNQVHGFYRREGTTVHVVGLPASTIRRYFGELDSIYDRRRNFDSENT